MLIRREVAADIAAVDSVTAAAFRSAARSAPPVGAGDVPGEVTLVAHLRDDAGWIPELSLVAVEDGAIVGHVIATRAWVQDLPALGLGPLSVVPNRQRSGVGSALMHAVLGAAEALDESLVGLLGEPGYYRRFGFLPARSAGITAPDPTWGDHFQVRALSRYTGRTGIFRYAAPFDAV
ncbi:GNAT family N-acetyltransferase [Mycobacterium sp. NPDC003323]